MAKSCLFFFFFLAMSTVVNSLIICFGFLLHNTMKCVIDSVIFGDPRYLQLKSYDSIFEVGELRGFRGSR